MMNEIIRTKSLRDEVVTHVWEVFQGRLENSSLNHTLLLTHYHLFIEHLDSIVLLIENKKTGSALSLLRTLLETQCRGLWLNIHLTDELAEKYMSGKFKFPGKIFSDLDKIYATDKYFQDEKKKAWEVLSDYTHTGAYQIRKRMHENNIGAFYTNDDILTILEILEVNLLLFTYLLLKELGKNDEAQFIREKITNRKVLKK